MYLPKIRVQLYNFRVLKFLSLLEENPFVPYIDTTESDSYSEIVKFAILFSFLLLTQTLSFF